MENKKISIIITTFNRPLNIISRAVESVIKQTYQNKQIIIVNAAPENYNLKKEIEQYAIINKIEYYEPEKNSNACVARNIGIDNSKGEYIAFLDDDDEWLPEKLEEQMLRIDNENVGLVYCNFYNVDNNHIKVMQFSNREGNVLKELLKKNIIGGCSIPLISKKAIEECDKFDVNFKSSQDYDMWIRICKEYEVRHVDKPLVKYYISSDAITRSIEKRISGWENLLDKHKNLYSNNKNAYNYFLNIITCELIKNGEFKKGVIYYKKALKINKITMNNLIMFKGIIKYLLIKIKKYLKG